MQRLHDEWWADHYLLQQRQDDGLHRGRWDVVRVQEAHQGDENWVGHVHKVDGTRLALIEPVGKHAWHRKATEKGTQRRMITREG